MKHIFLIAAAALGCAGTAAMAQDLPEIADADANGLWSLAELQTAYPALTEETFLAGDANADGGWDVPELTAAIADNKVTMQ